MSRFPPHTPSCIPHVVIPLVAEARPGWFVMIRHTLAEIAPGLRVLGMSVCLLNTFCLSVCDYAEMFVYSTQDGVQYQDGVRTHSSPYNSKSVMGERTAAHFTMGVLPLTNRLVT